MDQATNGSLGLRINKHHMAYDLDEGVGSRARIGMVTLATDHTIEHELGQAFDVPGVGYYGARLFNESHIDEKTLGAMAASITATADLILPGNDIDVVGYGCTAASMVIGEEEVGRLINLARPGVPYSTPITAMQAAMKAFGAQRVAILTPYHDSVNQGIRNYVINRGFDVPVLGSFNEQNDDNVARITLDSVKKAALELGRESDVDAVFVSCTNVRLFDVVEELEQELGKPVTSSNHALGWHCLRLAGIQDKRPFGSLYSLDIAK